LDTLIVDKNYRNKNYGSLLMNLSNLLIQNNNLHGMLLCKKKSLKFYKKFKWNTGNNIKNKLQDYNSNLVKLFFNKKRNKSNLSYYMYK
jgi:hypothetical protein